MTKNPQLTVVCATRNARAAVRLTFASYFRYNLLDAPIFVADNGSTDGTLEELRSWSQIQLVTLVQRRTLLAREVSTAAHARRAAPHPFGDGKGSGSTRALDDLGDIGEHGATLDWLVDRVSTPMVLVMDSDVEFLDEDCVAGMVGLLESKRLAALGRFEPGWHGYRPRLAPSLLLLRTSVVGRLGASFRPVTWVTESDEAERWFRRGRAYEARPSELATYQSLRAYPTAALLFERLVAEGEPWADLPQDLRRRFRHFGHMSWGVLPDDQGGSPGSRSMVSKTSNTIEAALRAYP